MPCKPIQVMLAGMWAVGGCLTFRDPTTVVDHARFRFTMLLPIEYHNELRCLLKCKLELLSPSTTYPLLQQSKGWQIRTEHL